MSLRINNLTGFGARRSGGGGPVVITYKTKATYQASGTTHTASSVALSSGNKAVLVGVAIGLDTTISVTLDGNAMTSAGSHSGSSSRVAWFVYETTATSATIVATYGSSPRSQLFIYEMTGYTMLTVTDTGTGTTSLSLDVAAGGGAVCISNDADPTTADFSVGTTYDANESQSNYRGCTAHYESASGDINYTWTNSPARSSLAVAFS